MRKLRKHKMGMVGGVVVGVFAVLSVIGPSITPHDPYLVDLHLRLAPPSASHVFGCDALGRDILSRLLEGARISLGASLLCVVLAAVVGVPIGLVSGYYGGKLDTVLMRGIDVLLSFPGLLLAIAIISVLGPGLFNAIVAVGLARVPQYARVARASALGLREQEFVEAARASGATNWRIILLHVFPNSIAPLIVISTLGLATTLLTISSLGFLGLGAQPPEPEWGAMLSDGRAYLRNAPHVATIPGIAIMVVVLAFNLFGDALRDALDPRLKE